MKLSILTPTLPERADMLSILLKKLNDQIKHCHEKHPSLGSVELLLDDRDKFTLTGVTVGAKRNALVHRATGDYLCFLDDDDDISPDYVETLLRLCETGMDICTFNSLFVCDTYWALIMMSLTNKKNAEATPEQIVRRRPWHICPVKSWIAKRFCFPDINNAEDWAWMEQVLTMCNSQERTNKIIHSYIHSANVSEVDAIERT